MATTQPLTEQEQEAFEHIAAPLMQKCKTLQSVLFRRRNARPHHRNGDRVHAIKLVAAPRYQFLL